MPLEILLILVVGGIAGIALALHLMGMSRSAPLDEATARAGWLRQFPDNEIAHLRLARNGRAALVRTKSGQGVVWRFGADTVAHRIENVRVREVASGLFLRFADFGTPKLMLDLAPDERLIWKEEIEGK